jgi:hypothetical protein
MAKMDKQPRRPSKPDAAGSQRHPPSNMDSLASSGDKESHEPLRRPLKGGSQQPRSSPSGKSGR